MPKTSNGVKFLDVILALVCGFFIAVLGSDLLQGVAIRGWYGILALWVVLPAIFLLILWLGELIGQKVLFVFQGTKHLMVGAVATVIDLKIFEWLLWFLGIFAFVNPFFAKSISFIGSTLVKYVGNKYWAFEKHGREELKKEMVHFFVITLVGLVIDVCTFYCATKLVGPQWHIPNATWIKLSVIFAAVAAATWNFLGYKFLVFKK